MHEFIHPPHHFLLQRYKIQNQFRLFVAVQPFRIENISIVFCEHDLLTCVYCHRHWNKFWGHSSLLLWPPCTRRQFPTGVCTPRITSFCSFQRWWPSQADSIFSHKMVWQPAPQNQVRVSSTSSCSLFIPGTAISNGYSALHFAKPTKSRLRLTFEHPVWGDTQQYRPDSPIRIFLYAR